jgi:hypothetical protein
MSATRQQERTAKQAGLLAQLRASAEYADHNASALAQQMFNRELEQMTEAEAWQMMRALGPLMDAKREQIRAARTPISGPHSHDCITCYEPVNCSRDDCRETMSEHSYCHEGFGRQEFDRTFVQSF